MVDIKNRGQLDKWLKDKPPIWAKVLAARSATRVFPLISSDRGQTDLTLSVGRTLLISWAACKWPTSEMRTANASAHAAANVTATAYASTAAATAAADYVARAAAAAAGGNVANVCIAASSAADAYARATADDAWQAAHDVWCAIEADIRQLEVEKSPETDELALLLLREPLWLLPYPNLFERAWIRMERNLLALKENWQVWVDWYRGRLNGYTTAFSLAPDSVDRAFTIRLASENDAYWQREPTIINADISTRLADALLGQLPTIPPTRPAMIEPEWQNDLLTLSTASAPYDEGTQIEEALRALRDDLREMADDLSDATNIDRRVKNYLERLADRVPLQTPTQYEIHRLGLAESNLADYLQTTVIKEWPDFLSGRMIGSMRQFDRVMRQFKSWRQFKQNAEQETLTGKDLADISKKMAAMAAALQPGEEKVIDPAIPMAMAVQIGEIHGVEDEGLEFNKVLIAIDAREGARNTVKELLGKLIELLDITVDWTKGGFKKEHKETGEKVGRVIYRLFAGLVICTGLATAASVVGMSFADIFALVVKSPELLKFLDGKEGWLAALLMLLASRSGKT